MRTLPTGVVSFLFTDIEGSTGLLERLGSDGYAALLDRHQEIVRRAIATHGGVEMGTEGDSFMVAFAAPGAAVEAATQAQQALSAEPWPEGAQVRVRMGVHTGEALVANDHYVGMSVHEAARVASAAHGGQILLSQATQHLIQDAVGSGGALKDLGEHQLRGIPGSQRLAQVIIPGLQADFPPLRTAGAPGARLPKQLSSFVSRPKELDGIDQLLGQSRLVTLVGPGGTGKTRLSVETGRRAADRFTDGVYWVALAGVRDASLVDGAIASALELHADPTRPTVEALIAHLHERELLLVLDNLEQVVGAAPLLGRLLEAAPRLAILATSRIPLHLPGEQQYRVPPLDLPDTTTPVTVAQAAECASVKLFVARAREVDPSFALTDANAPVISVIVERLDGLPLAIELAAARIDLLPVEAIRDRMEDRLSLLATRRPDVDERQRTLRGTIDWSYELLDEAPAGVFRRLGVFVGGFTLDAAEAVVAEDGEVLDDISALLDASLLRREPSPTMPRWRMLETVREYAVDRLTLADEAEGTYRAFASHWGQVIQELSADLTAGNPDAIATVEADNDNIRAALAWAFGGQSGQGFTDPANPALGAQICAAMGSYWALSHVREGSAWMTRALECAAGEPAQVQAMLRFRAGVLYDEEGRDGEAVASLTTAMGLFRQIGDRTGEARAVNSLGVVARGRGELERARSYLQASLALRQELGWGISTTLNNLGLVAMDAGDPDAARDYFLRELELDEAAGDREGIATARSNLAALALEADDVETAEAYLRQSLPTFAEIADTVGIAGDLEHSAETARLRNAAERAITLFAAATRYRQQEGIPQQKVDRERQDGLIEDLRSRVAAESFDAAWARGADLSIGEAVAMASESS